MGRRAFDAHEEALAPPRKEAHPVPLHVQRFGDLLVRESPAAEGRGVKRPCAWAWELGVDREARDPASHDGIEDLGLELREHRDLPDGLLSQRPCHGLAGPRLTGSMLLRPIALRRFDEVEAVSASSRERSDPKRSR